MPRKGKDMEYSYTDFGVTSPLMGKVSYDQKKKQKLISDLEGFKEMMRLKRPYAIQFDRALDDGTLDFFTDSGIRIVMPNEGVNDLLAKKERGSTAINDETSRRYDEAKRSTYLLYPYNVLVIDVDDETKTVTVGQRELKLSQRDKAMRALRRKVADLNEERMELKSIIDAEIDRRCEEDLKEVIATMKPDTLLGLKRKMSIVGVQKEMLERGVQPIVVPALVTRVTPKGCKLDILGLDIPGYLPVDQWNHSWVHDLHSVVMKGERVDVAVIMWWKNYNGQQDYPGFGRGTGQFICSRQALLDNPWEHLPYHKGDYVKVVVSSRPPHGHVYFGTISGTEIEVMCELPRATTGIDVQKTHVYECVISYVNTETRVLRAKTLREVKPTLTKA